jgi:hypothetical protein
VPFSPSPFMGEGAGGRGPGAAGERGAVSVVPNPSRLYSGTTRPVERSMIRKRLPQRPCLIVVTQLKRLARSTHFARSFSFGLRGVPGWISSAGHFSAASTSSRKVPARGSLMYACLFSS